jgi:hypothetical protein
VSGQPMTKPEAVSGSRYEPIAQIGRGGMAEVLLAMADAGGGGRRLAVLKRIWPEMATDPEFVRMFLDEARLSLRLNHPNVVQVYEVLVDDDELAIAMEYLDGQPLTRVFNRLMRLQTDLGLPLRLRIVASVLAGLEHAHTLRNLDGTPLGVVHRDVSPQNVFVTYDGLVKLVDFGVAKTLAASHQTRPGAIKGKLAYMAPEQLRGTAVDRRSDLFAVGVMLWEILAGRRMWHGMTDVEIVAHLAAARPMPILPPDPGLPVGLDAICARALDPDPERRYQTAAEMEMEIEGVLVGSADSHVRHLGKVVSMAFAEERAARQALIERHARLAEAAGTTEDIAADLPSESGSVEVTLSGLFSGPVRAEAPPVALVPGSVVWWRRLATVSGIVAVAALGALVGGWRAQAGGGAVAVAPAAVKRATGSAATPAQAAPEAARVPARPAKSSGAGSSDEEPHRHRRHRPIQVDEDATLPLSSDLADQ